MSKKLSKDGFLMGKYVRILCILIVVIMLFVLSVGCVKVKTEGEKTESKVTTESTETKSEPEPLKPVKLLWYVRAQTPNNEKNVLEAANKIIGEKINATLDLQFINSGDFNEKMRMIMSAQEEYDLAYTANWANTFSNNVSNGAYIELDDLLKERKALYNIIPEKIWEALKVNGKTYGVPNYQIMYNETGFWFKKDLIDKYNIDLSKVKKMEDLTPIYQTIKDNEPDVIPLRAGNASTVFMGDYHPEIDNLLAVNPKTWEVYDMKPTLMDRYKLMREWYQKGFFPSDVATLKDERPLILEGKIFSRIVRIKPGVEGELQASYGYDFVTISASDKVLNYSGAASALTGISTTSKNPERAMMLLELTNTDKELLNLLTYGIEGQDYVKIGTDKIEKKPDSYTFYAWQLGNQFIAYTLKGQDDSVWEETRKCNEQSIIDPCTTESY